MSKLESLSGRLQIRVLPQLLSDVDSEQGRLRTRNYMFGNRRPKQAAIVMTALKAFLALTPGQRDALYERYLPELEGTTEDTAPAGVPPTSLVF